MKKNLILVTALLTLSFNIGCSDSEGDTEKPVIILESPKEGATYNAGDEIHFDVEFSDNIALGSYKIDIHSAEDGHTHSRTDEHNDEYEFNFEKTWDDIAGKKNAKVHHHEIIIPADAEHGEYHFLLYCIDAAGNEIHVARNIHISDSE